MELYLKEQEIYNFILDKSKGGYSFSASSHPLKYINYLLMMDYRSSIPENELSTLLNDCPKIAFLDSLFIKPEYQGQGLYKEILGHFYKKCYSINAYDIYLVADLNLKQEVSSFNLVTFYEINGFKMVKELPNNQYLMFQKLKTNLFDF